MSGYFSYAEQAAHYFDRPHEAPALRALDTPAAWRGPEWATRRGPALRSPSARCASDDSRVGLLADNAWRAALTPAQVEEVERGLAAAKTTGRPTGQMRAEDFPLPTLAAEVARWRREIESGRGFQVISGVPVERWSQADAELFFWCLGLHMGRPGAQNPQGDLLGHVTDSGDDASDPYVRLYRTSANIAYHCDAADVVGLLCLRKARNGGASRIVSSVSVYNELLARRADLAPRLYDPFRLDIRNEDSSGALRYLPIPPCRFAGGRLRTFYHSDYFRSVVRHDDVPPFSEAERTLMHLYEEIASSPEFYLDMDLEPGDIQWLSNHSILHARTAYEDHPEPARKRHLLRLWLSIA